MERKIRINGLLSIICLPKMEQRAERNGTMWNAFFPVFQHGLYIKFASKYLYLKEGSKPAGKDFFKAALPLSAGSKMYVCMTNGFCRGSEVAGGHSKGTRNSAFWGSAFYGESKAKP